MIPGDGVGPVGPVGPVDNYHPVLYVGREGVVNRQTRHCDPGKRTHVAVCKRGGVSLRYL